MNVWGRLLTNLLENRCLWLETWLKGDAAGRAAGLLLTPSWASNQTARKTEWHPPCHVSQTDITTLSSWPTSDLLPLELPLTSTTSPPHYSTPPPHVFRHPHPLHCTLTSQVLTSIFCLNKSCLGGWEMALRKDQTNTAQWHARTDRREKKTQQNTGQASGCQVISHTTRSNCRSLL